MASGFVGCNKVWEMKEMGNGERALALLMGQWTDGEMQSKDDEMVNYELKGLENKAGTVTIRKARAEEEELGWHT